MAGSNRLIRRWDRRARRNHGTASRWDLFRTSSAWAMRRQARVLRPSLKDGSWLAAMREPVISYATPLCKVGRRTVWTSCQESTLRIGGPGSGKTVEMACRVLDAPGGVLVTSTAPDLYELTAPLRRERGPVHLFNPAAIGDLPSSLRWPLLHGCDDPAVATRRAADLIGPRANEEGERWAEQARPVLAAFLHAAALGGRRVTDIHGWIAKLDASAPEIFAALESSPQAAEMIQTASKAVGTTVRTRDGIMLPIVQALAWVAQPAAAACGDPGPGEAGFDVADLIDRCGSLYLLGDRDGTVAPLIGALTAEVRYQVRRVGARRRDGRLDPGFSCALDEVALVCPVPLADWMAESRKYNLAIHAAAQDLGQLRDRWGANGANTIINCASAVMLYGGCKASDDLALFGTLAGEREEVVRTCNPDGKVTSTTTRRVPVIPPAMLAALPNHRVLLVRRGMRVALAKTPIAWKRKDVRRALRAQRAPSRARQRLTALAGQLTRKETTTHA